VLGECKFGITDSRNRKLYERWFAELVDTLAALVRQHGMP